MYMVYGDQDEFLQAGSIQNYLNSFKAAGLSPVIIEFEGKREIHAETLLELH